MPFLLLRSVGSHNYRIVCCNLLLVRAKTIPKLPLHRLHIPPWKCVWLLAVRSEAPCSWTPPVRRKLPRKLRRRLGGGSTFEVKINLITKCERERLSTPLHGGVTVHWRDSMGEESRVMPWFLTLALSLTHVTSWTMQTLLVPTSSRIRSQYPKY